MRPGETARARSGPHGTSGNPSPSRPRRARSRSDMSDEERAAYREAKRQEAEEALDRLLTQDGWATWLRLRRHLHEFSWTNQALIAMQAWGQAHAPEEKRPAHPCAETPTIVKSAGRWKRDGFHPAKGTRGLYVWVFKSRRRKDGSWVCCGSPVAKGVCPTCRKPDHYFQLGAEFDASQVVSFETGEPPDLELPEPQPVTGDHPGLRLLEPLAAWAVEAGVAATVNLDAIAEHGEGGSFNHRTREVRVCRANAANHKLRVLIHELAHAKGITSARPLRGDETEPTGLALTYAEAEVAVETVSYIVASTAGLDTASEAIPYIAGWAGEDARAKVRALAALIDKTAKELEQPILALLRTEEVST